VRSAVPLAIPPRWRETWEHSSPLARGFGVVGLLLAFLLLIGFYIVVAGAVHRAEHGREAVRLTLDRQAACTAFSQLEARQLCALTMPRAALDRQLAHAAVEGPAWRPSARPQVAARLY
jgi:hypothetical protein